MDKLEILAPVGSYEALEAAVRCGANAVYLGQKNFSARKNSQNFDGDELKAAVEYAHSCNVAVHQALNILVFDHEFSDLKRCIQLAAETGVDALIVQDLGVARIVREMLPDMPLHASTQMAIHSSAGVRLAKELGFQRVVLARELSAGEIAKIVASTELETEVFVHGAHCMSISGQCYMSAVLGGKSGNRGQCAQPCRLPFTAGCGGVSKVGESVLSLKDMSIVKSLPELEKMGVTSVKIEGRMKRPEYVAAAVTACRAVLDGKEPELDILQAVFSRSGFTDGYFADRRDGTMFGFRRKDDVVAAGDVFKPLKQLYHKQTPLVPMSMSFRMKRGESVSLTVVAGPTAVTVAGHEAAEAFSAPTDSATVEKFLGKLGGTPYYLENLDCELDEGLMLPASAFNELRRLAVEQLTKARTMRKPMQVEALSPVLGTVVMRDESEKLPVWGKFRHAFTLSPRVLEMVDRVILPAEEILKRKESLLGLFPKLLATLPRFTFTGEEKLPEILKQLKELGVNSLYCESPAHLVLGRDAGMELVGSQLLNLSNSYAIEQAKRLGCSMAVVSIEGKLDWDNRLKSEIPLGLYGYGRLPLMAVRNCPVKAQIGCGKCKQDGFLTDRMGVRLPVRCDGVVSEIFNPIVLSMTDRKKELLRFSFAVLDFTVETSEEAERVLDSWKWGEQLPPQFTRGLYYRGVE